MVRKTSLRSSLEARVISSNVTVNLGTVSEVSSGNARGADELLVISLQSLISSPLGS